MHHSRPVNQWLGLFLIFVLLIEGAALPLCAASPNQPPASPAVQAMVNQTAQTTVSPFIGTIAVGISMLITYGPQILALIQTIAVLASAVVQVIDAGSQVVDLVTRIASKLRGVTQLVVGPLARITGIGREQAETVQKSLTKMNRHIVDEVDKKGKETGVSNEKMAEILKDAKAAQKEAEKLTNVSKGGENSSGRVENVALDVARDIGKLAPQAGGLKGYGDKGMALSRDIGTHAGRMRQEFVTARLGAMEVEGATANLIERADRGLKGEHTLTTGEISAELARAQLGMDKAQGAYDALAVEGGDLHIQIMEQLNGLRQELLDFAADRGVKTETLLKKANSPQFRKATLAKMDTLQREDSSFNHSQARTNNDLRESEKSVTAPRGDQSVSTPVGNGVGVDQSEVDRAYDEKVQAYQNYLRLQSTKATPIGELNRAFAHYQKLQKRYDDLLVVQFHHKSR